MPSLAKLLAMACADFRNRDAREPCRQVYTNHVYTIYYIYYLYILNAISNSI